MAQQAEPGNENAVAAGASQMSARGARDDLVAVTALLLMTVATGKSRLSGVASSPELQAAVAAATALGASVEWAAGGIVVSGLGIGVLMEPIQPIDVTAAPLTAALTMGLVSAHDLSVTFLSADSEALSDLFLPIGLQVEAKTHAQVSVRGPKRPPPRRWQVGAGAHGTAVALLLSALNTPGLTVIELEGAADPLIVRLFQSFGAGVEVADSGQGREMLRMTGRRPLTAAVIDVASFKTA